MKQRPEKSAQLEEGLNEIKKRENELEKERQEIIEKLNAAKRKSKENLEELQFKIADAKNQEPNKEEQQKGKKDGSNIAYTSVYKNQELFADNSQETEGQALKNEVPNQVPNTENAIAKSSAQPEEGQTTVVGDPNVTRSMTAGEQEGNVPLNSESKRSAEKIKIELLNLHKSESEDHKNSPKHKFFGKMLSKIPVLSLSKRFREFTPSNEYKEKEKEFINSLVKEIQDGDTQGRAFVKRIILERYEEFVLEKNKIESKVFNAEWIQKLGDNISKLSPKSRQIIKYGGMLVGATFMGALAASTGGVAVGASVGFLRLGRSFVGSTAGMAVGKKVSESSFFNGKEKKTKEQGLQRISLDNLETLSTDLNKLAEKISVQQTRNRRMKIGLVFATSAVAGGAFAHFGQNLPFIDTAFTSNRVNIDGNLAVDDGEVAKGTNLVKPEVGTETLLKPEQIEAGFIMENDGLKMKFDIPPGSKGITYELRDRFVKIGMDREVATALVKKMYQYGELHGDTHKMQDLVHAGNEVSIDFGDNSPGFGELAEITLADVKSVDINNTGFDGSLEGKIIRSFNNESVTQESAKVTPGPDLPYEPWNGTGSRTSESSTAGDVANATDSALSRSSRSAASTGSHSVTRSAEVVTDIISNERSGISAGEFRAKLNRFYITGSQFDKMFFEKIKGFIRFLPPDYSITPKHQLEIQGNVLNLIERDLSDNPHSVFYNGRDVTEALRQELATLKASHQKGNLIFDPNPAHSNGSSTSTSSSGSRVSSSAVEITEPVKVTLESDADSSAVSPSSSDPIPVYELEGKQ